MDLCDMRALKEFNNNNTFILTVIDVFSKFGFARVLPNKSGAIVLNAFIDILEKSGKTPTRVNTDGGAEFSNALFRTKLKERNIDFIVTNSEMKAAVVERWNRTLKQKMWRYFTFANTFKYTDIIDSLVDSYNKTPHRGIGMMRPIDVTKKKSVKSMGKVPPRKAQTDKIYVFGR